MEIFVYTDETIFKYKELEGNIIDVAGAGTLITKNPISNVVIEEAIENLKNDPDINENRTRRQDAKTIQTQIFHASEDSKNAHSHICNSINTHVNGNYSFAIYDKNDNRGFTESGKIEDVIKLVTSFSALQLFNHGNEITCINWIIESRIQLSKESMDAWIERWYKLYEDLYTFHLTAIPSYYPKIIFDIKGKTEPGLQVLDFILWSTGRKFGSINDSTWFSRLNLTKENELIDKNESNIHSASYTLKEPVKFEIHKPYPEDARFIGEISQPAMIFHLYTFIELSLKKVYFDGLPDHCSHLTDKLDKLMSKCSDLKNDLTRQDIIDVARTYVRVFDTMPIYINYPVEETLDSYWSNLLYAKKLAGFIVKDVTMIEPPEDIKDLILDWRRLVKNNGSEHFDVENLSKFE